MSHFLRLHYQGSGKQPVLVNTATIPTISADEEEGGSRIEFNSAVADAGMRAEFVLVAETVEYIEHVLGVAGGPNE